MLSIRLVTLPVWNVGFAILRTRATTSLHVNVNIRKSLVALHKINIDNGIGRNKLQRVASHSEVITIIWRDPTNSKTKRY